MNEDKRFDIALRSPVLVDRKDKQGWVELFAADGFIEDPVDAGRYRGHEALGVFWDVFIAPQPSIGFDVNRDFCGGNTLIRQATVQTVTEVDPKAVLEVPALLRYTVDGGKVASLQAIWEPRQVVQWFLQRGPAGMRVLGRQAIRMTRLAGMGKALSFGRTVAGGMSRVHAKALVDAMRDAEPKAWLEHFGQTEITVAQATEENRFERDASAAFDCLRDRVGAHARLDVDQFVVCGRHLGAFFRDADDRALAVMLRLGRDATSAEMTMVWSPARDVLRRDSAAAA